MAVPAALNRALRAAKSAFDLYFISADTRSLAPAFHA
jgi:hypothetical protein